MSKDEALWHIAELFAATCLSLEEAIDYPQQLDLKVARELSPRCASILQAHGVAIYAITMRNERVKLPSPGRPINGGEFPAQIIVERNQKDFPINEYAARQYSDQFMPSTWARSPLREKTEKAFRALS
ncbi:hypothetical protein [Pseudomonas mosselii]|uniref:Uncharacterized protein n=1 Tax=Pseudomonas mosselii TaxID=78327 RepID=A0ABX9AXC7_9PSED|nr:hypothetical protein [Pseudomonas mosselii]QZP24500.1 hypothetical protein K5H97_16815 [Pseudomonas mosselii]